MSALDHSLLITALEVAVPLHTMDRDANAALNLKNLAGSSPVLACCPVISGPLSRRTKLAVGQEPNAIESFGGIDG